jgi:hypothetical protein
MAQSGSDEITFNDNFNDLPIELKSIVISHINIKNLISYNDTEVEPFIDSYIKNYIENSLLTNAAIFTFLRRTKLYGNIINLKLREMATIYANDFIQQCNVINESQSIEQANRFIFFKIKYNHKINNKPGLLHRINTPKISGIHNNPINNNIIIIRNGSVYETIMMEEYIIYEIINSLCHFMDNFKGIYQVDSIELIETNSHLGTYNSNSGEFHIIKKYY